MSDNVSELIALLNGIGFASFAKNLEKKKSSTLKKLKAELQPFSLLSNINTHINRIFQLDSETDQIVPWMEKNQKSIVFVTVEMSEKLKDSHFVDKKINESSEGEILSERQIKIYYLFKAGHIPTITPVETTTIDQCYVLNEEKKTAFPLSHKDTKKCFGPFFITKVTHKKKLSLEAELENLNLIRSNVAKLCQAVESSEDDDEPEEKAENMPPKEKKEKKEKRENKEKKPKKEKKHGKEKKVKKTDKEGRVKKTRKEKKQLNNIPKPEEKTTKRKRERDNVEKDSTVENKSKKIKRHHKESTTSTIVSTPMPVPTTMPVPMPTSTTMPVPMSTHTTVSTVECVESCDIIPDTTEGVDLSLKNTNIFKKSLEEESIFCDDALFMQRLEIIAEYGRLRDYMESLRIQM